MKFELLISTTNNRKCQQTNPPTPCIIINQIIDPSIKKHCREKNVFTFYEKGLSKSRNRAISLSTADICLISDDDVEFLDDIEEKIIKAFKKYPDADIITFQVKTPEGNDYKNYPKGSFVHNKRTILKVSSVEIAFKKSSVIANNLKFDEHFGLGAMFPTGEEAIFLSDALKAGLKIVYEPIPIVIHPQESSGKNFHQQNFFIAKGALFYRLFGIHAYWIGIIFLLKKRKLFSHFTFLSTISLLYSGIRQAKRVLRDEPNV